jgi:hypothetical protein
MISSALIRLYVLGMCTLVLIALRHVQVARRAESCHRVELVKGRFSGSPRRRCASP